MLAKQEYSSPPDEVCCWPGRRGDRDAGRGAVVESHRESAAGRGAVAQHNTRRGRWCGQASGSSCAHREAAVSSGKKLASGSSGARRAEAGGQKPAGVQLFCVTAVVPTVGAELAFWQAYGCYEVFQSLELERCELHVFAHYVYHLFVLCAVAVNILLKYLL